MLSHMLRMQLDAARIAEVIMELLRPILAGRWSFILDSSTLMPREPRITEKGKQIDDTAGIRAIELHEMKHRCKIICLGAVSGPR